MTAQECKAAIQIQYKHYLALAETKRYRGTTFRNNIRNLLIPYCRDAEHHTGTPQSYFFPDDLKY